MADTTAHDNVYDRLKEKVAQYTDTTVAREWLDRNHPRVRELFENATVRNFVFEPIKGVFEVRGDDNESEIRMVITAVAVANMVMAGLPGKMGVGVLVSMALEGWMAWVIATRVGIVVDKISDIWKYFGLLAGIVLTVIVGFKELLGLAFSLVSTVLPGVNPLVFAELLVTNLVGVLFWIGFREAASNGSFRIPWRMMLWIGRETKDLFVFQFNIIRKNLSLSKLRMMGQRLKAWLSGDILSDKPRLRGEVFATAAMAWLLAREFERFDGPVGQEFIGAIRDRYPDLANASLDQIADRMAEYDPDQLAGVIQMIKGRLFERLVVQHENADGDAWRAVIQEDQSYPGSDITLINEDTGEIVEVSLKATYSTGYIESALQHYPDDPIMATREVAEHFDGDPRVDGSHFSNAELNNITESNFEELLDRIAPVQADQVAATGVAGKTITILWPFVIAYLRHRISYDQLEKAFKRVMGEAGVALAARVSYAMILGPIFAWYLLARGLMGLTRAASEPSQEVGPAPIKRRLIWQGRAAPMAAPSTAL
jgi:hypothetical protein